MEIIFFIIINKEKFKPISNTKGNSLLGQLKFYGRMALDFKFLTIYKHLKKVLPIYTGKVLDIGCGQSPYKYMAPKEADYFGIDVEIANSEFNYKNEDVTFFDGKNIPFENNTFDAVLCTEVLEHVYEHQYLINEMCRVLKPGAKAIVTIPS